MNANISTLKWIESTYGIKLESLQKKKDNKDLAKEYMRLSFNNAEPKAKQEFTFNPLAEEKRDGQMSFLETRDNIDTAYLYVSTSNSKKPDWSRTIRGLRNEGYHLPQNETDPTTTTAVIDVLELQAVERGLRRAVTNQHRVLEKSKDQLSFNSAAGEAAKDGQKYLSFDELLTWAKDANGSGNVAQTKQFVKVELDDLYDELKSVGKM